MPPVWWQLRDLHRHQARLKAFAKYMLSSRRCMQMSHEKITRQEKSSERSYSHERFYTIPSGRFLLMDAVQVISTRKEMNRECNAQAACMFVCSLG